VIFDVYGKLFCRFLGLHNIAMKRPAKVYLTACLCSTRTPCTFVCGTNLSDVLQTRKSAVQYFRIGNLWLPPILVGLHSVILKQRYLEGDTHESSFGDHIALRRVQVASVDVRDKLPMHLKLQQMQCLVSDLKPDKGELFTSHYVYFASVSSSRLPCL
jgi:hypothetical protein